MSEKTKIHFSLNITTRNSTTTGRQKKGVLYSTKLAKNIYGELMLHIDIKE